MDTIFRSDDVFLLIAVVIGLLMLIWQIFFLFKIYQSKYWNEAEGEVISSNLGVLENVGEVDTSYQARIKYQYIVENQKFVSSRIHFGDKLGSSLKSKYTKQLIKYPVGRKIKVFYNPKKNRESIVERKVTTEVVLMLIVSLAAIVVGLYFLDFSTLRQML